MKTVQMQCADEEFALRTFVPAGEGADGKQDFVCETCGWMQTSTAAGAAELCGSATWHDAEQYQRYAKVAREGGHDVPATPRHLWQPEYSRWRHGGWYVMNVRYPSGAVGCVSNNYDDKKWRIVCDERRKEVGGEGDVTFPTRDAAARAEYELAQSVTQPA